MADINPYRLYKLRFDLDVLSSTSRSSSENMTPASEEVILDQYELEGTFLKDIFDRQD